MSGSGERSNQMPQYQFLTNHAQVLLCVAHDPGIRLRDIAETVGVTERSAHRILSQLVEDGYVVRDRIGRRNVYKVKAELPLRHSLTQETEERRIGDLLEVLLGENGRRPARRQRQRTT
jgi:predicted transcriptional regulator of viral defense system